MARNDPFGAFNFLVVIDGVGQSSFSEVSGLAVEVTVIEYREGSDNVLTVRKIPGLVKYTNITLKRGVTTDLSLWNWFSRAVQGQVQRTAVVINLLDDQNQPVAKWSVREAWPCKYEGPDLKARGNDVAIELLEICHEGLERLA